MPKMKTHKASVKRFRITRNGKVMRSKGSVSHHRMKKRGRTKRMIDETSAAAPSDAKRIKRILAGS